MSGPYNHAERYLAAGWEPLPLPHGEKASPPKGFTGWFPKRHVTARRIAAWGKSTKPRNIALRMPDTVIGIDVDDYTKGERIKHGGATLTALESELGPLPDAPISTARDDGISGIRFFKVPAGLAFASTAGADIEIIHPGHRYAVVAPSWRDDLGAEYRWSTGDIPRVDELPALPAKWLDRLTTGDAPEYRSYSKVEIAEANQRLNAFNRGEPCQRVAEAVESWRDKLSAGGRHDAMVSGTYELLSLGMEGHLGVRAGLRDLRAAFADALVGERDARAEFNAAVKSGVDKICDERPAQACECSEPEWERMAPLDWRAIYEGGLPEPDWLVEPFIERGAAVALFSEPKAGKSLLVLEIVAALSCGRRVLGRDVDPIDVVYIDQENRVVDIHEHLLDMGFGWRDLARLHYYSFPDLNALDTEAGAQDAELLVGRHDAKLMIIDTMGRVVAGGENDSDTYHTFYRVTGLRLKRRGVAVLRLDHSGKDKTKGMRGSSAKASDVDAVWEMLADGDTLTLTRTHQRTVHGDNRVVIKRKDDPLRHEISRAAMFDTEDHVEQIVVALDLNAVPTAWGWKRVYQWGKEDYGWPQARVQEAVQRRKQYAEDGHPASSVA